MAKKYQVRDHCHHTGKYRGAAYGICNLRQRRRLRRRFLQ